MVREEAAASMWVAQDTMKRHYDAKRQADPDYNPGDQVFVSGKNLRILESNTGGVPADFLTNGGVLNSRNL
jgi:hypothetical protein